MTETGEKIELYLLNRLKNVQLIAALTFILIWLSLKMVNVFGNISKFSKFS